MLPGDDGYMMVEDEFQSIARSLTQHLHHAEYLRLKSVAKAQNLAAINALARPVDGKPNMSVEMKKRKLADAKSVLRSAAVQGLQKEISAENGREFELVEVDDDLWLGTSLHQLMAGPKRDLSAIAGPAASSARTRAAAGFPNSRSLNPAKSVLPTSMPRSLPKKNIPPQLSVYDEDTASSSLSDDDLDATIAPAPRVVKPVISKKPLPRETPQQPPIPKVLSTTSMQVPYHAQASLPKASLANSKKVLIEEMARPTIRRTGELRHQHISISDLPKPSTLPAGRPFRSGKKSGSEDGAKKIAKGVAQNDIPLFML
ncbi:MAG: hypothetical protein M1829_004913 [Trizodia sp. TS-e1964]|nr:MAG: hypothetical protein M1829_004913 [Trizodia sp. TS-e1964]